jgi:hypothetical protein
MSTVNVEIAFLLMMSTIIAPPVRSLEWRNLLWKGSSLEIGTERYPPSVKNATSDLF